MRIAQNTIMSILAVAMSVAAFTASAKDDKWQLIQALKVSPTQAVSIATAEAKGEAIELDLEFDDARAYYEIEIQGVANKYEIKVDADSGKILNNRVENDYYKDKNRHSVNVSMQEAIKTAEDETKARVKEVDLKDRDDKNSYYEIETVNADGKYKLKIDANTGEVLKVKDDK